MSNFDQNFEATRLASLAEQYSDIVKVTGEVVFRAEDDEDRLSGTSWTLEEGRPQELSATPDHSGMVSPCLTLNCVSKNAPTSSWPGPGDERSSYRPNAQPQPVHSESRDPA